MRGRSHGGATLFALGALLLWAAEPSPAAAATSKQFFGQTVFTHAVNALSVRFQMPIQYEVQTGAVAFVVNPAKGQLNSGTKPFYVGVWIYGVGDNGAGADGNGGGTFYVEFVPPAGVSVLTHNPSYRPYWERTPPTRDRGASPVRQPTVPLIVKGADVGGYDVALPAVPSDGDSHFFTYQTGKGGVEIFVPVRTTRKLTGAILPSCPQINSVPPSLLEPVQLSRANWDVLRSDGPPTPCPPSRAGNNLQVAVYIADAGFPKELVPWVDMITAGPRDR